MFNIVDAVLKIEKNKNEDVVSKIEEQSCYFSENHHEFHPSPRHRHHTIPVRYVVALA